MEAQLKEANFEDVCRTCLNHFGAELQPLFPSSESLSHDQIAVSEMLSSCSKYPVLKTDRLSKFICAKCIEDVSTAFHFKKRCESAYENLISALEIVDKNVKQVDEAPSKDLLKSEDFPSNIAEELKETEKCTQTDELGFFPCEKCDERFFSSDALRMHRSDKHKGSEHKCRICAKVYARMSHLTRHISVAHPELGLKAKHVCNVCVKNFTRKEHLNRHLLVYHQIRVESQRKTGSTNNLSDQETGDESEKHECHVCQMVFDSIDDYDNHQCPSNSNSLEKVNNTNVELSEEKVEMIYKLEPDTDFDACYVEENDNGDMNFEESGQDSHPEDEDFNPDEDNECVDDTLLENQPKIECDPSEPEGDDKPLAELRSQIRRKRGRKKKNANQQQKSTTKEHKCDDCGKVFTRGAHLKRHSLTHSEQRPFSCKICEKGFTRQDHLTIHLRHHDEVKPFICDICDRGFVRLEHLKRHKETRHGDNKQATPKSEFCEICKKGFTTPKYLQIHMKKHTDRDWNCKYCSEKFDLKSALAEHLKSHTHDKPFLCSECGLRFVRNDYLVIHMRRHKGEKPYKCRFCSKGFPRATDLTVHERYHTGEKTHLCTVCGKGFQRAYNLLVHMRVHTGERPYECPHCSKRFAQGNDLKAHVRRHTGERYKCDVCDNSFIQGYHLTQHKRIAHGIDTKSHIRRVEKFTTPAEQEQAIHEQQQRTDVKPGDVGDFPEGSYAFTVDSGVETHHLTDLEGFNQPSLPTRVKIEAPLEVVEPLEVQTITIAQPADIISTTSEIETANLVITPLYYTQKLKFETNFN